jgi:multidrug efflux system outer membrane protein
LRFDNGYTSYLEVLDANRTLFNAELDNAQTKATLFRSFVNLYKAMGGGWVTEADMMAVQGKN